MGRKIPSRYSFVRARNIFSGLDDYFRSKPIKLVEKSLTYKLNKKEETNDLNKQVGDYFELLAQGIHGGSWRETFEIPDVEDPKWGVRIEADVVSEDKRNIWESKSIFAGEVLKIEELQLSKYIYLQKFLQENNSKYPIITYEIFKHRVPNLFENFKNGKLEKMANEISGNILNSVSLPLSIITQIHLEKMKSPFVSKNNGEKWCGPYVGFNSKGLNHFIAYPEKTLEHLGLNPEDYLIKKKRFPKKITMNGKEINSFPILIIKDKFHNKWMEEFIKEDRDYYLDLFEKECPKIQLEGDEERDEDDFPESKDECPF